MLLNLIVTLLAPIFLGVTNGDLNLARKAAFDTVATYRATNQADLIAIAQIIGFGLAALGSLSLSMTGDPSPSMVLRLRGNANALNRSAEQNRRALDKRRRETPTPQHDAICAQDIEAVRNAATEAATHVRVVQQPTKPPHPTEPTPQHRNQIAWAKAMADVAGEITASLNTLPPTERRQATIEAQALTQAANDLLAGKTVPRPTPGAHNFLLRPGPA
jgi:hypothetical protein